MVEVDNLDCLGGYFSLFFIMADVTNLLEEIACLIIILLEIILSN